MSIGNVFTAWNGDEKEQFVLQMCSLNLQFDLLVSSAMLWCKHTPNVVSMQKSSTKEDNSYCRYGDFQACIGDKLWVSPFILIHRFTLKITYFSAKMVIFFDELYFCVYSCAYFTTISLQKLIFLQFEKKCPYFVTADSLNYNNLMNFIQKNC